MKNLIIILMLTATTAYSCKNTKNAHEDVVTEQEQKTTVKNKPVQGTANNKLQEDEKVAEKESTQTDKLEKRSSDSLIARIQRTPCYGTCPVYTISVYNTGFATYEGENFVDRKGYYGAYVSMNVLTTLQHMAQEIEFMKLQDKYDSAGLTDFPSTITTIRIEGKLKTVENRDGGPTKLGKFEEFFDSLFSEVEWDDDYQDPKAK